MSTLDIAIVAYGRESILRTATMIMPSTEGIHYVISWQNHQDMPLPDALDRPDVSVFRTDSSGISNNRNNALEHCTADLILLSDDDLTLNPDGIAAARKAMDDNPDVEFATFRSDHGDMSRFPDRSVRLGSPLPKGYSVTSFEIMLRRKRASQLRFSPELGLKAPRFHAGEEELLLQTAIRRNLNCRFFPITICAHPHESTGYLFNPSAGILMGQGIVIAMTWPVTAVLRALLKAYRLRRQGKAPFARAAFNLIKGICLAPAFRRRNARYLW